MKIHIELELTPRMRRVAAGGVVAAVLLGGAVAYAQATALPPADHVNRVSLSSAGVIVSQNGSWVRHVEHPGVGLYTLSFAAGAFSAPPTCVATALGGEVVGPGGATGVGATYPLSCTPATATAITCQSKGGTLNWEVPISLLCVGP